MILHSNSLSISTVLLLILFYSSSFSFSFIASTNSMNLKNHFQSLSYLLFILPTSLMHLIALIILSIDTMPLFIILPFPQLSVSLWQNHWHHKILLNYHAMMKLQIFYSEIRIKIESESFIIISVVLEYEQFYWVRCLIPSGIHLLIQSQLYFHQFLSILIFLLRLNRQSQAVLEFYQHDDSTLIF